MSGTYASPRQRAQRVKGVIPDTCAQSDRHALYSYLLATAFMTSLRIAQSESPVTLTYSVK